ncbi:MAG TPA: FtsX-like permease family protein [Planctomycetota bacterium]
MRGVGVVLRAARRESRGARGRLVFFTGCLALGAMAVVGVAGLVDSVRAAIALQSQELLGADVWIRSRRALPEELERELAAARAAGARQADVRLAQTMARATATDASRLVELKAVGPGFPFHGTLVLEPPGTLDALLDPERVVIAAELASAIGAQVGDEVALGAARFTVAALVLDEPGRLDPTFTAGPRVFSSLEGFERMQLGGIGSRITQGVLLALPPEAGPAAAWVEGLRERAGDPRDVRFDSHDEAQPQVRRAARRVERFLGLVALLSLILGGVGVAEIVRAWIGTRVQSVAVLRVLGFTPRQVLAIFAGHVVALAVAGSAVGAVLGSFLPLFVPRLLPELLPAGLVIGWAPLSILRGVGLGTLVALAFSLPALSAVWRVAPVRVLRHEAEPLPPRRAVTLAALALLLAAVYVAAWVQGGEADEAGWFTLGTLALFGLLAGGARGLTKLAAVLPRRRLAPLLVQGVAALARPGAGVLGAVVALGLGTLVVLTLVLVRGRLAERLSSALPIGGASVFFLDLQSDQRAELERILAEEQASSVRIVPLATARLAAIDGVPIEALAERRDGGGRGRWALTREQRITWQAELTPDNRIVAGEWWSDPARLEVSLEEDFAEDIGAALGSTLRFDLQGVPIELLVTSLRQVEWESFGINFFLVAEPGALDEAPHSLLAAADVPREREQRVQDRVSATLSNVTVIRVRAILDKVRHVLARAGLAVEVLGAFTALVGLVLLAGVASLGAARRTREAALWKVLGQTRAGVARLFGLEFALQGFVAGFLGALGACTLAWAFLEHVLELDGAIPWWTAPLAGLAAALLSALCGLAACARALAVRPIESLRG